MMEDKYNKLGEIFLDLKNIAVKYGIAIVTAQQIPPRNHVYNMPIAPSGCIIVDYLSLIKDSLESSVLPTAVGPSEPIYDIFS